MSEQGREMEIDRQLRVERGTLKRGGIMREAIKVRQGGKTLLRFEFDELGELEHVARELLRLAAQWRMEAASSSQQDPQVQPDEGLS